MVERQEKPKLVRQKGELYVTDHYAGLYKKAAKEIPGVEVAITRNAGEVYYKFG